MSRPIFCLTISSQRCIYRIWAWQFEWLVGTHMVYECLFHFTFYLLLLSYSFVICLVVYCNCLVVKKWQSFGNTTEKTSDLNVLSTKNSHNVRVVLLTTTTECIWQLLHWTEYSMKIMKQEISLLLSFIVNWAI